VTEVPQSILIESPPSGTVVGSPVVLAGRTTRFPAGGKLGYEFFDANGTQIGVGTFNVDGSVGQPARFNASLIFNPPAAGGPIRAKLYDSDVAATTVVSTSIDLYVAPPQTITIESPPPGTVVANPVVITGRLARYPFVGKLGYRVVDSTGRELRTGTFLVDGTPGHPTTFNGSLSFDAPVDGGTIRVELFDQNPGDGVVAANASIQLDAAPIQQTIAIDTPPPGTVIGSPVVITGQTTRYPFDGKLGYRIVTSNGTPLGAGAFNVAGAPGQPTTFNASIAFSLPRGGGSLRIELFDQNAATGVIVASTSIELLYYVP
jgi:hypothetical protein